MPAKSKTNPRGAGRKPGPKKEPLRLNVLPATKAWLKATGDMGQAIDELVQRQRDKG